MVEPLHASLSITANGLHGTINPPPAAPLQIAITANGGQSGFPNPVDLYFGVNVAGVSLWLTPHGTFSTSVTLLYRPLPSFGPVALVNLPRADLLHNGSYQWFVFAAGAPGVFVFDTVTTVIAP